MIWGDYHTHTQYSHGTGTVLENAIAAKKLGLKELAITDHGLKHWAFNIKRRELPRFFRDCEEAEAQTGVRILKGIENNINDIDGYFDYNEEVRDKLDVIQGGYHKATKPANLKSGFKYLLPNIFDDIFFHKFPNKQIVINTDVYLKLIENEPVDFINHINYGLKADALEVARQCKRFGTFVELNGKRVNFTDKEIEKMTEEGIVFILSSDAHSPLRVGDVSGPMSYVHKLHIPYEQIANWEKLPVFRSVKERTAREAKAKKERAEGDTPSSDLDKTTESVSGD